MSEESLAEQLVTAAGAATWTDFFGHQLTVDAITPSRCIDAAVVAVLRKLEEVAPGTPQHAVEFTHGELADEIEEART